MEVTCPSCDADRRFQETCEGCGGSGVLEVTTCLRTFADDALTALPVLQRAADHHRYPAAGGQDDQTPFFLELLGVFEALRHPDDEG